MTLRQMEHFLEMASCGSINRAAAKLGLNQQSLQASLNSLEKSVGFSLFTRSRCGLSLTRKGMAILPDIRRIVEIVGGWEKLRYNSEQQRILIVGTVTLINLITEKLALFFKEKYPNVALELHEARRLQALEIAQSKYAIAAFGSVPPPEIESTKERLRLSNRELEIVGRDDYKIFLNRRHPLAREKHVRLSQLAQFTAALYPMDDLSFCYREIYEYFSGQTTPHYGSRQENLLKLVCADSTVAAIFPGSAIFNPNVPRDALTCLPVEGFPMPGLNCLAYPCMDSLSGIEQELIRQIRETCRYG